MDLDVILNKLGLNSFNKKYRDENITLENTDTMDTEILKGLGFKLGDIGAIRSESKKHKNYSKTNPSFIFLKFCHKIFNLVFVLT